MVTTRSKTAPCPRPRQPDLAAHPSEEELITSFLRPRVVSSGSRDDRPEPCAAFIHDADVYSAGPAELTGGLAPALASNGDRAWYFFSAVRTKTRDGQRKARTVDTGEGCWHSEAGEKPVVEEWDAVRLLGHRQSFSFVKKVDGRRVRSGWLMVELSLDGAGDDGRMVLCKVYFSPRARADGGRGTASSAWASGGRKRKAAADGRNPASAHQRRRGRPPAEAAGTPTATNAEERYNTQSRGLAAGDNSVADDPADTLWTDDSFLSWWMRNRDWLMAKYGIVDRSDEELQKTLKLDECLRLLKYHYVDFDPRHTLFLNSC